MKRVRLFVAGLSTCVAAAAAAGEAHAQGYSFTFGGPGVSGIVTLTYGAATDEKYPSTAYKVTGVSGTFTYEALGIKNASIGTLRPITQDKPESGNTLAPKDFSRFPITGADPISFDNLFWPGGSPQTANPYMPHGGFLDIYGLLFGIGGGSFVNVWSNGEFDGVVDYGVAVVTPDEVRSYVGGGVTVSATPEPGAVWLVGAGGVLIGGLTWRRRRAAAA